MMMHKFTQTQDEVSCIVRRCGSRLLLVMLVVAAWWGQPDQFARAGVMIHVDFDPHTVGIQNSVSVMQGESFTANLVLEFSGDTSLGLDSYSFSVAFNEIGMDFVTAESTPVDAFTEFLAPPELMFSNQVTAFAAAADDFGKGPTFAILAIVGTIDFSAKATSGVFVISPYEDPVFDGFFDNQFHPIEATFNPGSVTIAGTVIPEPTSAVIALTALAFGVFFCRDRRVESEKLSA